MDEIIDNRRSEYIIVRYKGMKREFYNGCTLCGRDKDNVLRVSRVRWSDCFYSNHVSSFERAQDILIGMKKYENLDNSYTYCIAELQTTVQIINQIERQVN